jgi:hypothetical protein
MGLGCVWVAIAIALCIDGSYWGLVIAWVLGTWGAMLVAWGLIAGWYRSLAACVVSSLFALSAIVVALLFVPRDAWGIAIPCAIGSALSLPFSVYQVYYLLRRRRNQKGFDRHNA